MFYLQQGCLGIWVCVDSKMCETSQICESTEMTELWTWLLRHCNKRLSENAKSAASLKSFENLEPTWNSKWGKAALSWAALLRLEVPTWFSKVTSPTIYRSFSPQRLFEGSWGHLQCCLSLGSLHHVDPWRDEAIWTCLYPTNVFIISLHPPTILQRWVAAKNLPHHHHRTWRSRTAPMTIPGGSEVGKSFMLCTTKSTWGPGFLVTHNSFESSKHLAGFQGHFQLFREKRFFADLRESLVQHVVSQCWHLIMMEVENSDGVGGVAEKDNDDKCDDGRQRFPKPKALLIIRRWQ